MIKITDKKAFFTEIGKSVFKIVLAGVLIGLLKSYDWLVAIILLLKVLLVVYKNVWKVEQKNWILLVGMFITGVCGILAEYWGVSNHHWEYHEVSSQLPLWLPFAWMLAFRYLYRIESGLIQHIQHKSLKNKLIVAFWLTLIFPALGEMVTIYLGVWTYYWPYQILGVPLFAFVCLLVLHMFVYTVVSLICKKYGIKDPVFSDEAEPTLQPVSKD